MADEPLVVPPDGFYTPDIKPHSIEKIRLHNRYAEMFASAMHRKWPQLAYIGLYSGAGHARRTDTGEVVETSALAVLRQRPRFTDYIYVENDPACIEALNARSAALQGDARVTIIPADVNESAEAVRIAMPSYGAEHGLLSFCFIDPFDVQLKFHTIRRLASFRVDFLILLMLGVDARRNFKRYREDESSTRIGDLIDFPEWRTQYVPGENVVHFLLGKFNEAMARLGYPPASKDAHSIRVSGKGVFQYLLAFYSKSEVGLKFWRESRRGVSGQFTLDV